MVCLLRMKKKIFFLYLILYFFLVHREERYEYIRAKYVDKKFALQTCADERDLLSDLDHAVNNKNLYHLLQVFAEGVDLGAPLPTSVCFSSFSHDKVVYF